MFYSQAKEKGEKTTIKSIYFSAPNRHVGRNKRAGGKILKKTLNVQDRIDVQDRKDVQGGNFS